jgi:hypothetical protein
MGRFEASAWPCVLVRLVQPGLEAKISSIGWDFLVRSGTFFPADRLMKYRTNPRMFSWMLSRHPDRRLCRTRLWRCPDHDHSTSTQRRDLE